MRRNDNTMRIARQSAAYRLTLMGIQPPKNSPAQNFVEFIARETGFELRPGEDALDYLNRFNALSVKPVTNPRVAGPRYTPKFRPYVPPVHPRQAEIDAAPRQISMPWDGTGVTWQQSKGTWW